MLAPLAPGAAALLQLDAPESLAELCAALHADWRSEAIALLAERGWRAQLVACAAIVAGGEASLAHALWAPIDAGSWIAPQLVAAAFLVDARFTERAEERLLGVTRRSPKLIGALVRAYHRLPKPPMAVLAQLGRHDPALHSEEGRIGVRGVDRWLDRMPSLCDRATRDRFVRMPRAI
jgi:hypothetical protein